MFNDGLDTSDFRFFVLAAAEAEDNDDALEAAENEEQVESAVVVIDEERLGVELSELGLGLG